MEQITISKFKATCLGVLGRVNRTGKPVLVTRFGKPIAEIVPPPITRSGEWLGAMRDTGRIEGNIIEPVVGEDDWEAVRDS